MVECSMCGKQKLRQLFGVGETMLCRRCCVIILNEWATKLKVKVTYK